MTRILEKLSTNKFFVFVAPPLIGTMAGIVSGIVTLGTLWAYGINEQPAGIIAGFMYPGFVYGLASNVITIGKTNRLNQNVGNLVSLAIVVPLTAMIFYAEILMSIHALLFYTPALFFIGILYDVRIHKKPSEIKVLKGLLVVIVAGFFVLITVIRGLDEYQGRHTSIDLLSISNSICLLILLSGIGIGLYPKYRRIQTHLEMASSQKTTSRMGVYLTMVLFVLLTFIGIQWFVHGEVHIIYSLERLFYSHDREATLKFNKQRDKEVLETMAWPNIYSWKMHYPYVTHPSHSMAKYTIEHIYGQSHESLYSRSRDIIIQRFNNVANFDANRLVESNKLRIRTLVEASLFFPNEYLWTEFIYYLPEDNQKHLNSAQLLFVLFNTDGEFVQILVAEPGKVTGPNGFLSTNDIDEEVRRLCSEFKQAYRKSDFAKLRSIASIIVEQNSLIGISRDIIEVLFDDYTHECGDTFKQVGFSKNDFWIVASGGYKLHDGDKLVIGFDDQNRCNRAEIHALMKR